MVLNIDIVARYEYNSSILWYVDKSGMRFSREQLEYIVDSSTTMYKKLPLELLWLDRFAKSDIVINMKRDKLGRLLSTKRDGLKVVKLKELDTIYVLCEDSKGGYVFYQYVLGILFPTINFVFDTSHGNHNITNTLVSNMIYDKYIFITDYKQEDYGYTTDISYAEQLLEISGKSYISFHPVCIEEVLLSWKDLMTVSNSDIHQMLSIKHPIQYYIFNFNSAEYTLWNGIVVKNLEKYLFKELNRISKFKYTKDILGYCIVRNCDYCDFKLVKGGKSVMYNTICTTKSNFNKITSLARGSLLLLLCKAMTCFNLSHKLYSDDYVKYFCN